jgi:hypothetical protein
VQAGHACNQQSWFVCKQPFIMQVENAGNTAIHPPSIEAEVFWRVLVKPRITGPDIYYKVYVTNTAFYFIKISGQFHNNRDAFEYQLPLILKLIFWPWFKKIERKQSEMEAEYDAKVNINQVSELLQKKYNFSIAMSIANHNR